MMTARRYNHASPDILATGIQEKLRESVRPWRLVMSRGILEARDVLVRGCDTRNEGVVAVLAGS